MLVHSTIQKQQMSRRTRSVKCDEGLFHDLWPARSSHSMAVAPPTMPSATLPVVGSMPSVACPIAVESTAVTPPVGPHALSGLSDGRGEHCCAAGRTDGRGKHCCNAAGRTHGRGEHCCDASSRTHALGGLSHGFGEHCLCTGSSSSLFSQHQDTTL